MGLEVGDFLAPFFILMVAVIFAAVCFWWVRNFVVWFGMKTRGYREDEVLYLNNTPAMVTKVGFLSTRFLIFNDQGLIVRTASVSNLHLESQRIERIAFRVDTVEALERACKERRQST